MQKIEKNVCYQSFLFFVIFSISFKQNFLKPKESCLLDRKKPNIAKLVYINFLDLSMKIAMLQPVRKFSEKRLFSVNPIKAPLFRVFLHAEFISALKTEPKPTVFEKYAENRKKYLSLFSIFCDFLYQFQAKFPKTKRIMFVRQKEAKYSQISIYQFFCRQHENRRSKILRKEAFSLNPIKIPLLGYFCMQN